MKIVTKHGNSIDKVPQEAKCDLCGCEFTFTREDCWWNRPLLTYQVSCPECDETIDVGDIYD